MPIWYYTTQNNDVATLPGRFIFQPYVSKNRQKKQKSLVNERSGFVVFLFDMDAFKIEMVSLAGV